MRNIQLSKMDVKLLLILSQMAEPRVEMRISFFFGQTSLAAIQNLNGNVCRYNFQVSVLYHFFHIFRKYN